MRNLTITSAHAFIVGAIALSVTILGGMHVINGQEVDTIYLGCLGTNAAHGVGYGLRQRMKPSVHEPE